MIEMKDSGISFIGMIPSDWNVTRNKNVFSCTKELVGTASSETQLLSLTTKGIKEKDINNPEGKLPESFDTYQFVKKNDMVMCLFDLDVSAVFSGLSPYDGMISPAYRVLHCKNNIIPKFADYWFRYISDGRKFNHYAKNIRYTLNYEDFSTLPIVQPPIDRQCRIVDYLDEKCSKIDAIIEKQQTVIEKLKAYKLSIITEAVTNGLNPDVEMKDSGVEWIGEIPSNWKITSISRLATVVRGASPRPAGDPLYFNGSDVPWITVAEVTKDDGKYITSTSEYLTSAGAEKSRMVESGTLLLSNSGATLGVPKVTLIDGCINDGSLAFYNLKIDQIFLLYVLKSRTYELRKEMSGYGQPNLNTDIVKAIKIPLPPQEKQEDIVKYLDQKCPAIDKVIADRQVIIEKLGQYKKSLIYEVVTGKKEI
jgi:type I restriction modification DNA specificity domain protein